MANCGWVSLVLTAWLVISPALAEDAAEGPVAAAAGGLTVGVSKTNDADGNGQFNKFEEVPVGFSGPVKFRVRIKNTSAVPVQIIGLTDESPPNSAAVSKCPELIGKILQPDEEVVCAFSQTVSPDPGNTKLDRFRAKVGRGTTPPTVEQPGGGGPGLPCTDPDPARCIPPCPDPPITPLPPGLVGCAPASETGEGMDDSGVRNPFQFPIIMNVEVEKTNDADGDTLYSEVETALAAGGSVTFRIVVTNLSPRDLVITTLTDEFPGQPAFPVCTDLINTTLGAGSSVSCTFSVPNYAPPPGGSTIDTVRVDGRSREPCTGSFPVFSRCSDSDADPSTVRVDPLPPGPAVTVDKVNDADGDDTFTDLETAPASGAVTFRVVVTNPSTVPVTITSITDEFPGQRPFAVSCAPNLISTTLQPNTSASCTFVVPGYSPAPGSDRTDTVRVAVVEQCAGTQPCRTATASDPSTVRTREEGPPHNAPERDAHDRDAPDRDAPDPDASDGDTLAGQGPHVAPHRHVPVRQGDHRGTVRPVGGFLCLVGRARAHP